MALEETSQGKCFIKEFPLIPRNMFSFLYVHLHPPSPWLPSQPFNMSDHGHPECLHVRSTSVWHVKIRGQVVLGSMFFCDFPWRQIRSVLRGWVATDHVLFVLGTASRMELGISHFGHGDSACPFLYVVMFICFPKWEVCIRYASLWEGIGFTWSCRRESFLGEGFAGEVPQHSTRCNRISVLEKQLI